MSAIELNASAHNRKVAVSILKAYYEICNVKVERLFRCSHLSDLISHFYQHRNICQSV